MHPPPTPVQLRIARFLCDVVRASGAWTILSGEEPIVVRAPNEDILLLWPRREDAARAQRSGWPMLTIGRIDVGTLVEELLPALHRDGVVIGLGSSLRQDALVTLPPEWLERALRAGIERGWSPGPLD